jgi:S-adenosylmethionine:tRNA ribosyltransferase-isomerase
MVSDPRPAGTAAFLEVCQLRLSDFYYDLPEELIAQDPAPRRDESRLMVLRRDCPGLEHRRFRDVADYLQAGDTLVLNETRVIPARLVGHKEDTGANIEVLLLSSLGGDRWETLVRPGHRVPPGTKIVFGDGELRGTVMAGTDFGGRLVDFQYDGDFTVLLDRYGKLPLPPYIKKQPADPERYQTVYAKEPGSAAAPTAGLHFTPELLAEIKGRDVHVVSILLHVGLGTFRPVQVDDITEHKMHAEFYRVSENAAAAIGSARRKGGRVIAVGTTVTRCLETAAGERGEIRPGSGWTDIFIYPGYQFKAIDGLITNFHLPHSTLLMMISALAGRERVLAAYQEAVRMRYRFFSFGDAMLIL